MRHAILVILLLTVLLSTACGDNAERVFAPPPAGPQALMFIEPQQCGQEPWNGMSLDDYFAGLGVEAKGLESLTFAEAVCLSCSCPTGQRVCVRPSSRDRIVLEAEGFATTRAPSCAAAGSGMP